MLIVKVENGKVVKINNVCLTKGKDIPQGFKTLGWCIPIINDPPELEEYQQLGHITWTIDKEVKGDYTIRELSTDNYRSIIIDKYLTSAFIKLSKNLVKWKSYYISTSKLVELRNILELKKEHEITFYNPNTDTEYEENISYTEIQDLYAKVLAKTLKDKKKLKQLKRSIESSTTLNELVDIKFTIIEEFELDV